MRFTDTDIWTLTETHNHKMASEVVWRGDYHTVSRPFVHSKWTRSVKYSTLPTLHAWFIKNWFTEQVATDYYSIGFYLCQQFGFALRYQSRTVDVGNTCRDANQFHVHLERILGARQTELLTAAVESRQMERSMMLLMVESSNVMLTIEFLYQ
jgi:hypothetical protein